MPTSAPGASRRITSTASPCESRRWCAAASASGRRRPAGRVLAEAVAEPGGDPRLVVGDPERDAVAEPAGDASANSGTPRPSRAPASRPRSSSALREVPVVEGDDRRDPVREQLVHEPVVEVEAGLVRPSRGPRAGRAATRRRSGRRRRRARAGGRRPLGSDGRSRTRLRRSRRCGRCPGSCRSGPRCSRPSRPR